MSPGARSPHNLLALDYRAEAQRMGAPPVPIIDIHTHIQGDLAAELYDQVRRLYGVTMTYSMTQLPVARPVADRLGDSIRFIAIPTWSAPDRGRAHGEGYLETIERFHGDFGSRMLKIWGSPQLRDFIPAHQLTDVRDIDSPARVKALQLGERLGMMNMVHIADPNTWFAAKYTDVAKYGAKRDHYAGLERMLDRFGSPWIAAHMGGWPEDLNFLDGLLTRHPNLHLDTSATKWVIRELSKHPREEVRRFFEKWINAGRILFGSDIVVSEDQVSTVKKMQSRMSDLADSPESAFDLYASRYWALRTMFETKYDGPSPIADPDLMMVEPTKHDALSAPTLRGMWLSKELLTKLYRGNAEATVERWWREHP